jgi:hypothetical protein
MALDLVVGRSERAAAIVNISHLVLGCLGEKKHISKLYTYLLYPSILYHLLAAS